MGSVIGMAAFGISTLSGSIVMLMVTYGIIGGIGFGLIYLPAIVSVGYYFESKRALATGIAVCGSGFGTFVFAPLAAALLEAYDWKGANLILAGIILNCAVSAFHFLLRPRGVSWTFSEPRLDPSTGFRSPYEAVAHAGKEAEAAPPADG